MTREHRAQRTRFTAAAFAKVLVTAVGLGAVAAPAMAEGGWSSYLSGWHIGKESRSWTDSNNDDVSTRVVVSRCTYNWPAGERFRFHLRRDDTWTPDEDYGGQTYYCDSNDTGVSHGWGDHGEGSFYFRLTSINGDTDLSWATIDVDTVKVVY